MNTEEMSVDALLSARNERVAVILAQHQASVQVCREAVAAAEAAVPVAVAALEAAETMLELTQRTTAEHLSAVGLGVSAAVAAVNPPVAERQFQSRVAECEQVRLALADRDAAKDSLREARQRVTQQKGLQVQAEQRLADFIEGFISGGVS